MNYVHCKALIASGRCRRKVEWRRAYCPAHQRAHDEAKKAEAEVRDLATELCCLLGEVRDVPGLSLTLTADGRDLYRALYAANERLQSALVASTSFGGVDPDAEEVARG